jgi:lysozyme
MSFITDLFATISQMIAKWNTNNPTQYQASMAPATPILPPPPVAGQDPPHANVAPTTMTNISIVQLPTIAPAPIKGIDISQVQGVVIFQAVADSGIQFVAIRCGVGNDGSDRLYAADLAGAKQAGLKTIAYHFVYPLPNAVGHTGRDPVSQAQAHFAVAQGEVACADFEWPAPQDWAKWSCSANQLNDWMLAYLIEYTRLSGKKPLLYTYPYFIAAVNPSVDFAQYKLWIASYQSTPTIPRPWQDWSIWQTSGGGGKLPGGAPVDTDVCKDLSIWE